MREGNLKDKRRGIGCPCVGCFVLLLSFSPSCVIVLGLHVVVGMGLAARGGNVNCFVFFFPSSFVFVVGLHVDQAASQLPPGTKNTRVLAKTRRGRKKNIGNINKAPVRPGTFSRKTPIWRELNTPRKQKTNTLGGTENTPPGTKNTLPSAYSSFENVEVGALKSYSSHDFYNFWPRIPD